VNEMGVEKAGKIVSDQEETTCRIHGRLIGRHACLEKWKKDPGGMGLGGEDFGGRKREGEEKENRFPNRTFLWGAHEDRAFCARS